MFFVRILSESMLSVRVVIWLDNAEKDICGDRASQDDGPGTAQMRGGC
jgi:hypothetical protein